MQRLVSIIVIGAMIAVLELCVRQGIISSNVVAAPTRMVAAMWSQIASGAIAAPLWQSGRVFLMALALALLCGLSFGLLLHALPRLRWAVDPLLTSYYAVPIFVFYPVLIVLIGLGDGPLVIIGAMFSAVAMTVATLNALERLPAVYLKTGRVIGLGWWDTLWRIRLPAMAPHLMAGTKIAVAYAMIGVIGGEFILSTEGLGYRISFAYNNFETEKMYGLMLFIVVAAVTINGILHSFERKMRRRAKNR